VAGLAIPRWRDRRIVLAADISPWLRPDAACSPDRLFCHVHGRGKGQAQMIPGWPCSFVAALEPGRSSRGGDAGRGPPAPQRRPDRGERRADPRGGHPADRGRSLVARRPGHPGRARRRLRRYPPGLAARLACRWSWSPG
jgi:hypothetical protein